MLSRYLQTSASAFACDERVKPVYDAGINKTFTQNLEKTPGYVKEADLNVAEKKLVQERVEALAEAIKTVPKSSRWKMRSLIGDKVSWYDEPEAPKTMKFAEE